MVRPYSGNLISPKPKPPPILGVSAEKEVFGENPVKLVGE
jgi:hypothetical protein